MERIRVVDTQECIRDTIHSNSSLGKGKGCLEVVVTQYYLSLLRDSPSEIREHDSAEEVCKLLVLIRLKYIRVLSGIEIHLILVCDIFRRTVMSRRKCTVLSFGPGSPG
jgi:hypothetical protein